MTKEEIGSKWGVPVKRIGVDRCESHIILKDAGIQKRPRKCLSPAISVGIIWKGQEIWLCRECWNRIADLDLEWGEHNGLKIFKDK